MELTISSDDRLEGDVRSVPGVRCSICMLRASVWECVESLRTRERDCPNESFLKVWKEFPDEPEEEDLRHGESTIAGIQS